MKCKVIKPKFKIYELSKRIVKYEDIFSKYTETKGNHSTINELVQSKKYLGRLSKFSYIINIFVVK